MPIQFSMKFRVSEVSVLYSSQIIITHMKKVLIRTSINTKISTHFTPFHTNIETETHIRVNLATAEGMLRTLLSKAEGKTHKSIISMTS